MLNSKIKKIKSMRRSGYSFHEIVRKAHVSSRDALKYSTNIKFSRIGKIRHKNLNGIVKDIKRQNKKLSGIKIRIIGNLLFDGSVYMTKEKQHVIMYVNSSYELVKEFCEDVLQIYGVKPNVYDADGKYVNLYRAKCGSKLIYLDLLKYMKSYSTSSPFSKIPEEIMNGSKFIKKIFLQTFWNNEGSVSSINGALSGTSKSRKVIEQLFKLHVALGINLYICKDKRGFYILKLNKNNENYQKFYRFKLFTESRVAHGYAMGSRKIDVLRKFL
ncbi:hypothetical protein CL617_01855 [archaeon]|nr:hypothetical protein [archaeon]